MKDNPAGELPAVMDSLSSRFDAICDQFEAAWKQGPARIEDFLTEGGQDGRARQFAELLALELEIRSRRGEVPGARDYLARFPEFASQISARVEATVAATADGTAGTTEVAPQSRGPANDALSRTRFRVLRRHAEGGLGLVSLARDEQFGRDVALKEIKPDHAGHAESRRRFMLEAEVTGGLEHPGIVPVYDLGRFEDGRPYYAMRFIQGESLQETVQRRHASRATAADSNARAVELRKLLRRFLDVCEAIAYAHSRGVLHRDLKPANIMLGQFGETLVVDWGLAKVAGKDGSVTDTNCALLAVPSAKIISSTRADVTMGTPQYMSPEQAAGQTDLVGPTSDIYSLGATLYFILTGKPPVSGNDLSAVLKKVREDDIVPPRQVAATIAAPLEAICLKAMARRPEDRYASAKALAEDIERWLADEPVGVYRDPLPVRLYRAARRHKVAATAIAALSLAAIVGLSIGALLLGREQARTETARQEAVANLAVANAATVREQKAAELAQQNYGLALGTLHSVIFDIQEELADLPAAEGIRRGLLNSAMRGLDKLAGTADNKQTPQIETHTWAALTDLGSIYKQVGDEDGHHGIEMGRELDERALAIARRLTEEYPGNDEAQHDLIASHINLGADYNRAGDAGKAVQFVERALKLARRRAEAKPGNVDAQVQLSLALRTLGGLVYSLGEGSSARKYHAEELEIRRRVVSVDSSTEHKRDLAAAYLECGLVECHNNDPGSAQSHFQQAIEITRPLAEADPNNVHLQLTLAREYHFLSDVLPVTEGALRRKLIDGAREICLRLSQLDPYNDEVQRSFGASCMYSGRLAFNDGDVTAAKKYFEQGLKLSQRRATADLADLEASNDLSRACRDATRTFIFAGDGAAALKYAALGVETQQRVARAFPNNSHAQAELAAAYENAGNTARDLGDLSAARTHYECARRILETLACAYPNDYQTQRDLLGCFQLMVGVEDECTNFSDAKKWIERSRDLMLVLVKRGLLTKSDPDLARANNILTEFNVDYAAPLRRRLPSAKRLVTTTERWSFSPDGSQVAYSEPAADGNHNVRIVDVRTGATREFLKAAHDPAWQPGDGRWIACDRRFNNDATASEIWVYSTMGDPAKKLCNGVFPAWTADGKTLYCYSPKDTIFVEIDRERSTVKPFALVRYTRAAISPDTRLVAFPDYVELNVMERETLKYVSRIPVQGSKTSLLPGWSPDGKQLAFGGSGETISTIGLWLMEMDTGRKVQVAEGRWTLPVWSNDGSKFSFMHMGVGDRSIWVADAKDLKNLKPDK